MRCTAALRGARTLTRKSSSANAHEPRAGSTEPLSTISVPLAGSERRAA
jgi:hypothetical protein